MRCIEEQTGIANRDDWYPLSFVQPVSKIISSVRGEDTVHITCHPHCSLGTYLFIEQGTGKATPITRFTDIEGMFKEIEIQAAKTKASKFKRFAQMNAFFALQKYYKKDKAPAGLDFTRFLQTLDGFFDKEAGRGEKDGTYNYDLERVRRCVIHYTTPPAGSYRFAPTTAGSFTAPPLRTSTPSRWKSTGAAKREKTGLRNKRNRSL